MLPNERRNNRPAVLQRRFRQALKLQQRGNLAAAQRECRRILRDAPDHAAGLELLGILLQQGGNLNAALHHLQRALRAGPPSVQLLKNLAAIHHLRGELNDAADYVEQALEMSPNYVDALYIAAEIHFARKQYSAANNRLQQLLELDPEDVHARNLLGNLLCVIGDLQAAKLHYRNILQQEPDFDDCRLNLAMTLYESGDLDAAIEQFSALLQRQPSNADLHYRLAQTYQAQQKADRALTHYTSAIDLDPNLLDARLNMGRLELERDPQQAERWFESVLELDAKNAEAHYWLGISFQTQGKFDRATHNLLKAIRHQPDFISAWYRLSLDRDFVPSEAQIEGLLRLQQRVRPAFRDDNSLTLEFTLGRFFEQRRDYARAFQHFTCGNRQKAAKQPFDPAAFESQIEAIVATFDADFYAQRRDWGDASERPVFIVGMPRSGTTLVEQILSAHPRVHGAGELRLMQEMAAELNAGKPGFHADRIARIEQREILQLARQYLAAIVALRPDAERILDKLPGNFYRLGLIRLLFPSARIVHCRRNPLDTCWSCFQQNFDRGLRFTYDLGNLGLAYRGYQRLMAHWHTVMQQPIFDIDYETLVTRPQTSCRKLLQYCSLPWDHRVLQFHQQARTVNTASIWQARQPLYQTSIGHWQHYREFLRPLMHALAG